MTKPKTTTMTNVKIKTMFFFLNAFLTADFVLARPQNPANISDVVFVLKNNVTTEDEYQIPVENSGDTLIVVNDDETPEQQNKNSKTDMDSMVDAEQGRDELILSKKHLNKPVRKVLDIPKEDAAALEKQLNTSSPLLEEIIDSETGREEKLTDIMFRPMSPELQFDVPRFEFLIAGKINENSTSRVMTNDDSIGKDKNSSDVKSMDFVELVAIGKGGNGSVFLLNITEHEVEDDLAPDTSYTDVQTLFLACFATLVPLLGVLFSTLWIRCMIRRWCPGCRNKSSESTDSESSDLKADMHQQLKTDGSTVTGAETLETESDTPAANGSIITMTLKNNHLIVETEERNDITKNGRETKMKYSPDNDGIFVVEVQQSAIYRPNPKSPQNSPRHDPQISTNQALIHRVPDELETNFIKTSSIEDSDSNGKCEKVMVLSQTGLTISDLSMSSVGLQNYSYSYGDQLGYEQGPFGYPIYSGYDIPQEDIGDGIIHDNSQEPLICKTPADPDKPVITAAIFKQDSIIGNDVLQGPGYCIEGSSDGPLLSDVQAREVSLQHLHEQMEKKIENGIDNLEKTESPKKHFSRADSLPVKLEEEKPPEPIIDKSTAMDAIQEDECFNTAVLKGKRASLPIISTEMYESVKDTIVPTGSPKFEMFTNDESPEDNNDYPPPMITITEEIEPALKCENGSS